MIKKLFTLVAIGLLALLAGQSVTAEPQSSAQPPVDRSLAPYFKVLTGDTTVEQLPLKSTSADVKIAGVIADVTVAQVYTNTGARPIEAIYTFPASTRAAVNGLTMTIGDRTVRAVIKKREDATREYEAARSEGRTATLLEEERPNVFTMKVANIMPGDEIKVEMRYTELIVPTSGTYEFVYPTVVGPRYSSKPAAAVSVHDTFVATPYTRAGVAPSYDFSMKLALAAGMPIQRIESPSHKIAVNHVGLDKAVVTLDPSERAGGNRDFIIRYRLAGEEVASGLLLYKGARENFFLMTIQPPERVEPRSIPQREYVFIVDISGSMQGWPLEISKKLLRDIVLGLRPEDSFNIITFASGSELFSESSVSATESNLGRATEFLSKQTGGGGTELLPALQRALDLPRVDGVSRCVIIATDGYVDVEKEAFDIIAKNLDRTNVFAFGIGGSVNRFLMEGIARIGQGEAFIVEGEKGAAEMADRFRDYIKSPVFTGIRMNIAGFDAYDVTPTSVPDLFAERPIVIMGKWRGNPEGRITLTGWAGGRKRSRTVEISKFTPSDENSAIGILWARNEIARLDDYNSISSSETSVAQVTKLGLEYSLLTAYTSFVAVDEIRRNVNGKIETIQQALPMPAGVENSAVGCEIDAITSSARSVSKSGSAWIAMLLAAATVIIAVRFRTAKESR